MLVLTVPQLPPQHLKTQPASALKSLMSLSDSLASLNRERYRSFAAHSETTKPETDAFKQAALAFDGPAFRGLAFSSLDKDEVRHAVCLCGDRSHRNQCRLQSCRGLDTPLVMIFHRPRWPMSRITCAFSRACMARCGHWT